MDAFFIYYYHVYHLVYVLFSCAVHCIGPGGGITPQSNYARHVCLPFTHSNYCFVFFFLIVIIYTFCFISLLVCLFVCLFV